MATLKSLTVNDTGFLKLPTGTTAQRPGTTAQGQVRYNSTEKGFEAHTGSRWRESFRPFAVQKQTSDLVVELDAADTDSYPGTGTTWSDLSGNGNDFSVVAAAWNSKGYFDFGGSNGMAKNASDISLSGNVTYVLLTRVLNNSTTWRTLTRAYGGDHHVIIQSGQWNIGMYDNNGGAFQDLGYDQTSLPGNTARTFDLWVVRWQASSPYMEIFVNGRPFGSSTSANAQYNRGFGSIGGYHGGNTTPGSGSQYWGDIAYFAAYSKRFTNIEVWRETRRFFRRIGRAL